MITKVSISKENSSKAIAFLNKLADRKAETIKKVEAKTQHLRDWLMEAHAKNSPYTWFKEENDQGNFSYTFRSDSNVIYSAFFELADYERFMKDFPILLQNGYEFGFFRKPDTSRERDSLPRFVSPPKVHTQITGYPAGVKRKVKG